MNKRFMLKESVFAVTLAMASLQLVQAQVAATPTPPPTAEAEATLQRVTVTGSNIKRINAETASPIQIITKEELTRGGATSLNEVLRTIAVNQGGQSELEAFPVVLLALTYEVLVVRRHWY